jgi:hypothetical protein
MNDRSAIGAGPIITNICSAQLVGGTAESPPIWTN